MKKLLWFDVETTGLSPAKHDIIQIAGIVEVNGRVQEEFNYTCRPCEPANIDESVLAVHGRTKEEIMSYPSPVEVKAKLIFLFMHFIDKFNKRDKFIPAGYNTKFDIDFLSNFFKKCGDNYFGSWMQWQPLCVMHLAVAAFVAGKMDRPINFKLETLCQMFGIGIDAHDALSDIRATRELGKKLMNILSPSTLETEKL